MLVLSSGEVIQPVQLKHLPLGGSQIPDHTTNALQERDTEHPLIDSNGYSELVDYHISKTAAGHRSVKCMLLLIILASRYEQNQKQCIPNRVVKVQGSAGSF